MRYTPGQIEFANKIIPEMVDTGILSIRSSEWSAATLFPLKKPGSKEFRIVNNFININKWTIKSQYPIYSMDTVINTVI